MIKRCTRCGAVEPLDAFGLNPKQKGGRKSWCKKCYSTYNAAKLREYREDYPLYS